MHPRTTELLEHLDRHYLSLQDAVVSVPPTRREIAPGDGEWSVANVLEHVALVNSNIARLLQKKLSEAKAAGLARDPESTSVLEHFDMRPLLNRQVKVSSPEFVRPTCAVDARLALEQANDSHAALRSVLTNFDGLALGTVSHAHPIFGTRNFYEWFAITGGHTDRHAAQIREIGQRLNA
jgi:hypothetical protein